MDIVLDAGADDLRNEGGRWEILSAPEAHYAHSQALEAKGIHGEDASIAMVPRHGHAGGASTRRPCCELARRWKNTIDVAETVYSTRYRREEMERLVRSVRVAGARLRDRKRTGYVG